MATGSSVTPIARTFQTQEGGFHLTASLLEVGQDLVVVISGGERPHVGAVALADPRPSLRNREKTSATASVLCLSGHKEDSVVKAAAERLAGAADRPVAVVAGMHWDNLQESGISQVMKNVDTLIGMIEASLHPTAR